MAKTKAKYQPLPIIAGMGEHGLALCLIENQERKTPFRGGEDKRDKLRCETIRTIVTCRAHGMRERETIANARRFVREWFVRGTMPNSIGNPAVRLLAHSEEYPITGKARFVEMLTIHGSGRKTIAATIGDAEHAGLIRAKRGIFGIEYRLTYEPRTRAVCDLAERVADLIHTHPDGLPFRDLRHVAARIVFRGLECGAALIERALNAGVIRAEFHGEGRRRERFIFPNFEKGK